MLNQLSPIYHRILSITSIGNSWRPAPGFAYAAILLCTQWITIHFAALLNNSLSSAGAMLIAVLPPFPPVPVLRPTTSTTRTEPRLSSA